MSNCRPRVRGRSLSNRSFLPRRNPISRRKRRNDPLDRRYVRYINAEPEETRIFLLAICLRTYYTAGALILRSNSATTRCRNNGNYRLVLIVTITRRNCDVTRTFDDEQSLETVGRTSSSSAHGVSCRNFSYIVQRAIYKNM